MALRYVIIGLQKASSSLRLQHESLVTGAICIYMFNALIYRPGEGRAESALLKATSQHISVTGGNTKAFIDERGAYFLSGLDKIEGAFQLPKARKLDDNFLCVLYRRDCIGDIVRDIKSADASKVGQTQSKSIQHSVKRKRRTILATGFLDGEEICDDEGNDTDDEDDDNSDKDDNEDDNHNDNNNKEGDAILGYLDPGRFDAEDLSIRQIIRQFPSCIMQVGPRPRSKDDPPYILLDDAGRQHATIEVFHSFEFQQLFNRIQYKILTGEEWHSKIFARFFPPCNHDGEVVKKRKKAQGFTQTRYLEMWVDVLQKMDPDQAERLRENLFVSWFSKIGWLPYPESDRMWSCEAAGRGWTVIGGVEGRSNRYPRLAINDKRWNDSKNVSRANA